SGRSRHTRFSRDWSSDVCSSDLLIFWTTLTFIILLVILRSYAWKPILKAVKDREKSIEDALNEAKKAREEMSNLKAENDKILRRSEERRVGKECRYRIMKIPPKK